MTPDFDSPAASSGLQEWRKANEGMIAVADAISEGHVYNQPVPELIDGRYLHAYAPNALSHSRLTIFQRCQRRFYIEYERGMERLSETPKALRMGGAFALALEHSDPKRPWIDTYAALVAKAENQNRVDDLMIESATVEWYAGKYIEIWGKASFREIEYEFEIPGTAHTFRGAVDALESVPGLVDNVHPIEDKFKAQWTETDIANLRLDSQVTAEIYGLREMGLTTHDLKYRVTLKPRILRRKGRGKDATPEPVADFVQRIIETVEAAPHEYFLEERTLRTDTDLSNWMTDMQDWVAQIEAARERGRFPASKETCSYNGGCAHREVCLGVPSAASLYQKKNGYPE